MSHTTVRAAVILAAIGMVAAPTTPAFGAVEHHATLSIATRTSPIYTYAGTFDTGPFDPATEVSSTLQHCPAGDYQLSATLVQDGVAAGYATGDAMGAWDVTC